MLVLWTCYFMNLIIYKLVVIISDEKLLSKWQQGNLPSNTEANPREHLKVIILSSGKEVGMNEDTVMEKEKEPKIEISESLAKEEGATPIVEKVVPPLVKEYVPRLPYPSRLKIDPQMSSSRDFRIYFRILCFLFSFVHTHHYSLIRLIFGIRFSTSSLILPYGPTSCFTYW